MNPIRVLRRLSSKEKDLNEFSTESSLSSYQNPTLTIMIHHQSNASDDDEDHHLDAIATSPIQERNNVSSGSATTSKLPSLKLSKRWRSSKTGSKENCREEESVDEDEIRMNKILNDKELRSALIQKLISVPGDFIPKIRFLIAVQEWVKVTDKREKKAKGRKMVGIFIQNGSMFQLSNIPPRIASSLCQRKQNFDSFQELSKIFIADLISCRATLNMIRELC